MLSANLGSVGYTARQAVLAALTANAIRPVRNPWAVVPTFLAGWLTNELAPHLLAVQAADTAVAVARRKAGPLGLLLAAVSAIGLISMVRRSSSVSAQVDELLRGELDIPGDLDPPTSRRTYARPFAMHAREVEVLRNLAYTEGGRRAHLDIYRPQGGVTKAPVLIQIHGGGWTIGNKEEQGLLIMNRMASRGWIGVSVNYRLAPKHRWPTQIIDVKRAIAWVRENIADYGGDPDYIVLTGGSAGGHLSALAALTPNDPQWQPGFEDADTTVTGAVPFYGVYDFTADDAAARIMREHFLSRIVFPPGAGDDDYLLASPMNHITENAPDFLVVHGAHDSLVPVKQARIFTQRLRDTTTGSITYLEIPGAQHAFDVFGSIRAHHTIRGVQRWLEWHHARWEAKRA
jgi:acetyl esterase/lipase